MGCKRHVLNQLFSEDFFASLRIGIEKRLSGLCEKNIAIAQLYEPENLQGFSDWKKIVDFELKIVCEFGKICVSIVGRSCNRFDHSGEQIGGYGREMVADTDSMLLSCPGRLEAGFAVIVA